MTSKLFKASIALLVVGAVLLVILQVFYFPKTGAFTNDLNNYAVNQSNNIHTEPPILENYGLDYSTLLFIVTLGNIVYVLLFLGASFLVIILIGHLVKRTQGHNASKASETP